LTGKTWGRAKSGVTERRGKEDPPQENVRVTKHISDFEYMGRAMVRVKRGKKKVTSKTSSGELGQKGGCRGGG